MLVSPIIYLSFPILEFKAKGKWRLKGFLISYNIYFFIEVEDFFFDEDEGIYCMRIEFD